MLLDEKPSKKPIAVSTECPNEGIPLLPIDAMAGVFSGEVKVLELECERFVIPTFKEADFLIPVKGSSMHPKYNNCVVCVSDNEAYEPFEIHKKNINGLAIVVGVIGLE
ncbi:peptidase S24-like protein [Elysia marginata]|uniref:Peptidase S24-like protein n=1 Tax=Elysia marginata TaxID=1093978 RepID=A0AAV4FPW0_9GAST|nr:peptidase S24-like protein [Elysia marginata]